MTRPRRSRQLRSSRTRARYRLLARSGLAVLGLRRANELVGKAGYSTHILTCTPLTLPVVPMSAAGRSA